MPKPHAATRFRVPQHVAFFVRSALRATVTLGAAVHVGFCRLAGKLLPPLQMVLAASPESVSTQ
jgi:hypothetical protein